MDERKALYHKKIIRAYNSQSHRGVMSDATVYATEENVMCGDELTVYLKISNGIVEKATYEGESCVVCMGSAEISAGIICGMETVKVIEIDAFDIEGFISGIDIRPSRRRCANLFVRAAKAAIRASQSSLKQVAAASRLQELDGAPHLHLR